MTRKEFLTELDRRLSTLPRQEAEEHINYYAEMLADRMEEGMTEEEAVRSMESIDVIASRILGARYIAPARKNRGRRTAMIAVIATIVAVVAIISCAAALFTFRTVDRVTTSDIYYIGESGEVVQDFRADGIRSLQIDWTSAYVTFHIWEENTIRLQENGSLLAMDCYVEGDTLYVKRDTDDMVPSGPNDSGFTIDDSGITMGGLVIDDSGIHWNGNSIDESGINVGGLVIDNSGIQWDGSTSVSISDDQSSSLAVYLPRSLAENGLDDITINVVSAEVELYDINAGELALTSISGNCTVDGRYSDVVISTTSGEVFFTGSFKDGMFNTVSGDLSITADHTLNNFEVNGVSGDISLFLPADMGFELEFDTVSGDFYSGDFAVRGSDGRYTCGDGAVSMTADTVSGDFWLSSCY